jgi:hypothetical protein
MVLRPAFEKPRVFLQYFAALLSLPMSQNQDSSRTITQDSVLFGMSLRRSLAFIARKVGITVVEAKQIWKQENQQS